MKRLSTLTVLIFLCLGAWAQNGQITGTVRDANTNEPLIGANIIVANSSTGTSTDENGTFSLNVKAGEVTLEASYVSYQTMRLSVTVAEGVTIRQDITMEPLGVIGEEVVVSGSKKPEKLTESPATIETVFAREIQSYAGNPAELIARQKGIDYFRAGIATPAFNIRGFNSNFNSKNLQVTDGRFSTLVATGLPFGPLNTTIKEDIERVEVVLGPNATMYGPNAHNGLLNTVTKDPRTSEGTMITLNAGVSGDGDPLYSVRARHANVINDKFAFKIMGEYTQATEFEWADSIFIDRLDANGNLRGTPEYAGPDGIAEGYEELELDRGVDFTKLEGALYYTPTDDLEFVLNSGYSNSNYLSPTNVGRNQIKDWSIFYTQLRVNYKNLFAQVYYTKSATDDTYSIDDRTKAYYTGIDLLGLSDAEARGDFSYSTGARFRDDSDRINAEVQYNNTFGNLELIAGGQWQQDRANSLGSYLIEDPKLNSFYDGGAIVVNQYGGYAHLTYNFGGGFKALAAARADYHDVYEFNFVPKFGLLKVGGRGTWRLTYGKGIAAPTILNMFGDLFSGLILGNAEGFTVLADNPETPDVIETAEVAPQRVEQLQTFELGYRGQLVKNKLFLDANAYYNISKDFLSPVTVVGVATERGGVPIAEVQSGFATYGGLVATYINFGEVNTYGVDIGLNYYFTPEISAYANYSYFDYSVDEDNLENDFNNDGVVNFLDILVNAPTHKMGFGLNYNGPKFSAGVFGRWVQAYDYFSSFQIASQTHEGLLWRGRPIVENARSTDAFNYGPLGGFTTFDLNLGYQINERYQVNLSAVNVFNQEIREFTAAAPTKGIYTVEFRVNLAPKKD
ncbi:TonB-dependent receptor [Phaeodactylibacter luteus]|uniref:TonB-dependent receptor n=1 Tax=Phaeodactylibacter luteus TaxID=1564516 RepID=A0A5C6RK82_9BACT|nr:TonB-dependent receptor [Phaeodactylibacter luteus]TXB62768.1 TonB-dependent receptor [Phaeodactylibacter luteus]